MKTNFSFLTLAIIFCFASVHGIDAKERNGAAVLDSTEVSQESHSMIKRGVTVGHKSADSPCLFHLSQDEAYQSLFAYEDKRMNILHAKLEQHKERLEAHNKGHRLLSDAEHSKLSHQSNLYARHLKQLAEETKEEKLEKIMEAKEFHSKHHHFGKANMDVAGL
jgi:hypothetical protein